ncbi:MAG: hypothetical protein AMXMBFR50_15690 [Ignavibacterium album]
MTHLVIFSFAFTSLFIGLDCIFSNKIIIPSRYSRRLSETYNGIAAYAHGIIFIILAGFLFVINYFIITEEGNNAFKMIIKRPGFLLVLLGTYILSYSIIAFKGYQEQNLTTKFVYYLELVTSRMLMGIILLLWGIGFIVVGFIEIVNAVYFDSIGGGFIEVLFDSN